MLSDIFEMIKEHPFLTIIALGALYAVISLIFRPVQKSGRTKTGKVLSNLDNEPVADLGGDDFLQEFDEDQQKLLLWCIDNNYPIDGFAFPKLPAECMETIIYWLYRERKENSVKTRGKVDLRDGKTVMVSQGDIWKVVHSGLRPDQYAPVMRALTVGVKMTDRIENLRGIDALTLAHVATAAECGEDICDMVNNRARYLEIEEKKNVLVAAASEQYLKQQEKDFKKMKMLGV